jgi:hypothetical protein
MPDLDVDSLHSIFRLFLPEHETLDSMAFFDLIVIEEVGQISAPVFDRLLRLWDAAGRRPVLAFVGDFAQLRGVEPTRALDSPSWSTVFVYRLHEMRRCLCADLRWKLELLRSAKPSLRQLRRILVGHKAPSRRHRTAVRMTRTPSNADLHWVFTETPNTTFATITRAAAARVNSVAVSSFYSEQTPLVRIPADPEANPTNYDGITQVHNLPLPIDIHVGLRLTLTRNINKNIDYVNGMGATVQGASAAGIRVLTDTHFQLMIYPWTDDDHSVFLLGA